MSLRRCPRCNRERPLEAFAFRDAAHTRLQSYCRGCVNAAWREWYADDKNRRHHLNLVAIRRRKRIARNRAMIRALKDQPCADCGIAFPPEAMDFDHIGPKRSEISRLVYDSATDVLRAEAAECEVVCANCHRIRTVRRLREGAEAH